VSDEVARVVDGMVDGIRAERIVVRVANVEARNSGDCHERSVVTPGTERQNSAQKIKPPNKTAVRSQLVETLTEIMD